MMGNMQKMKMETPNLTEENIKKILEMFPQCATEVDKSGEVVRGVNFDLLKQYLSPILSDTEEAYTFDWVGKKASIIEANKPIHKALRPVPEKSKNWDTTENIYIEGDNLDALKLLQESYLGKVKMIYIDPPYNTGNDFIYRDDYTLTKTEYDNKSRVYDEAGNRLFRNNETNGRFHSDWCSGIYSRLLIARSFLREDGAIFISMDDNEIANLRKICDEVFGNRNFLVQIIWKKRSTPPNDQVIGAAHEYILVYCKNKDAVKLNLRIRTDEQNARYQNPDHHPKGPWAPGDLSANVKGGRYVASLYYPIVNPNTGEAHYPPNNGNWRFSKEKMQQLLQNDEIYFGKDGKGRPKLKRFLRDVKQGITYTSLWDFVPLNTAGSAEMTDLMGNLTIFSNPKPTGLIEELLRLGTDQHSLVMDFYSGSATTAHAVMALNEEDKGQRRFILVQLPEKCEEGSEAYKAGYKVITDIGEERIRRAGARIEKEAEEKGAKAPDTGFRVFKVDDSNMKPVYYAADDYSQAMLDGLESNIKEDRTDLDLLFGCLVDWGLPLSKRYRSEEIDGVKVHDYDNGALVACFAENVPESVIKAIARKQPLRVVFRDSCFADSAAKINLAEIFKMLSPDTTIKVL